MGITLSVKRKFFLKNLSKYENNEKTEDAQLYYYLPNVEKDTDIMVILHFLNRYLFQGNFKAPIGEKLDDEPCKVLDVG